MAVVNKWVDTSVEAGKKGNPAIVAVGQCFALACTFEVAATDSDTSVFKLAKLKSNLIPVQIKINADSSLGASDWDLGLYKENGDVLDKDCFLDGQDLNAGAAMGSEVDGLGALPIDDIGKKIWEITSLGLTAATRQDAYILAFTANTAGAAAGTISLRALFIQG